MDRLLAPFHFVMFRLSYARKFALIGGLFLIPIVIMLYTLYSNMTSQIQFSAKERLGVEYNQSLKAFMIGVQKHRGLSNSFLSGQQSVQADVDAALAEADQALAGVDKQEDVHGTALETAALHEGLHTKWEQLKKDWKTLQPADNFKRHSELVSDILNMTVHVSDTSNLTLDPDLDTYYLMESTTRHLPTVMEYLGQARGSGSGALARKAVTADEKVEFTMFTASIQQSVSSTSKGMDIGFKYNPELEGKLKEEVKAAVTSADTFRKLITDQLINGSRNLMSSKDFFDEGTKALEATSVLYDNASTRLDELLKVRVDNLTDFRNTLLLMVGVVLFLVILFFISFYRNVLQSVVAMERMAKKMADGDLRDRIELRSKDELSRVGTAFNKMADSFSALIESNKVMAEHAAASAAELNSIANESVQATNQMAEAMQQIASGSEAQVRYSEDQVNAMEEMARGVMEVADSSSSIAQIAAESAKQARVGRASMEQAVARMNGIEKAVQESAGAVGLLGKRSGEIGEIVSVIGEISEQTHLLALNAAIEAARAGDQGRGFAVVAGEVRKLAEASKTSADSIRQLIEEVTALVNKAVNSMEESVAETQSGAVAIQEAGQMFIRIQEEADHTSERVIGVSAIAEELSAVSQEVAAATTEMVDIAKSASASTQSALAASEEQLAGMEEVYASTEALSNIASELKTALGKFKV